MYVYRAAIRAMPAIPPARCATSSRGRYAQCNTSTLISAANPERALHMSGFAAVDMRNDGGVRVGQWRKNAKPTP